MSTWYVSSLATGSGTGTSGSPYTLQQAYTAAASGDQINVKADGTYAQSANPTFSANFVPTASSPYVTVQGYGTTPGDGVRPTIQLSGAATAGFPLSAKSGWLLRSLDVDCNGVTSSIGFDLNQFNALDSCSVHGFTNYGVKAGGYNLLDKILAYAGTSAASAAVYLSGQGSTIRYSRVKGNQCTGVLLGNTGCRVHRNLIYSNTGASSLGIDCASQYAFSLENNVIDSNGSHGISLPANLMGALCKANILLRNGGYGLYRLNSGPALPEYDGNFYGSGSMANSLGTRHANLGTGTLDVLNVSTEPYSLSAENFALNAAAAGGALIRGAVSGSWLDLTMAGYLDGGAAQHPDSGGGSGGVSPWEGAL